MPPTPASVDELCSGIWLRYLASFWGLPNAKAQGPKRRAGSHFVDSGLVRRKQPDTLGPDVVPISSVKALLIGYNAKNDQRDLPMVRDASTR